MDAIGVVKAYFSALDANDWNRVEEYLTEDYRLEGFQPHPMDKQAMLEMVRMFKTGLPNLEHSLSNISVDGNVVRLTVQWSGTNSAPLDLRPLGMGVVPKTQKFVIFPNGTYEIILRDGKIAVERDISPVSPNRRMSGMLKALGVTGMAL